MEDPLEKKKKHRKSHAGRKKDKKDRGKGKDKDGDRHNPDPALAAKRNPKAFAIKSAISAERKFRRTEDLAAKRHRVPAAERAPASVPPPVLVAIAGPPRVGKTSLVRALIKSFTRTRVSEPRGPVTLVTSKKQRITLLEVNSDPNSMIDAAKCADLMLLLCDASFGFEMEMFELLNACQVHGMPKVMGVLTHLDAISNQTALKKRKKALKRRFWTEVYDGAKLFYLSGQLHGEYLRNEIKNLSRFISVMKFRRPAWRGSHAYVLADRLEDVTDAELVRRNPEVDRDVVLYGYVRGVPLVRDAAMHLAGVGDFKIDDVGFLPDPCPLPGTEKKRTLSEKERLIYAPFSGVGGIIYDRDAVYVELKGSQSRAETEENSEKRTILKSVTDAKETVDDRMKDAGFRLFSDGEVIYGDADSASDSGDGDDSDSSGIEDDRSDSEGEEENGSALPWENFQNDDDLTVPSENSSRKWRENMAEKAVAAFLERQNTSQSVMKLVYGVFRSNGRIDARVESSDDDGDEIGGLFKRVTDEQKKTQRKRKSADDSERSLYERSPSSFKDWSVADDKRRMINCFVTGKRSAGEDASELLKLDDADVDDSDELFGDFEDLETGEKRTAEGEEKPSKKSDAADVLAKKLKLKAKFDSEYDNPDENRIKGDNAYYEKLKEDAQKQTELNKTVFEELDDDLRVEVEGYRPGMYVRINFKKMPRELVENFDPSYPLLLGALNVSEENIGYVCCKIKKHRWYKRILKTNDPLIISMGWRRFQTTPIFSKLEDDMKCRYLKYTPEHVTCNMHFYGPITPQNTGVLALQTVTDDSNELKQLGFRIAATGSVGEIDKSTNIVKKLKLVGTPLKILKKTAFIKDMFNSSLEVAKFEGAKIKTVSGIRGQIKRAVNKPEGCFRATFEDKILLSDIVFCRTWFKVNVTQFYTPVTNLLLKENEKNLWSGMKTLGQLKRERDIKIEPNVDSLYKPIQKEHRVFKPLVIPKTLQKSLPYKDKPKKSIITLGTNANKNRVAVIKSPYEQKVGSLMKMLKTNYKKKKAVARKAAVLKIKKRNKELQDVAWKKLKRQKELKKKVCRALSKMGKIDKKTT